MVITRYDIENDSKRAKLVEKKLDDMGVEIEYGADGAEIRDAAEQYYGKLLQEHLNNSDDEVFDEYFDNSEGIVWGFVDGYRACLRNHNL